MKKKIFLIIFLILRLFSVIQRKYHILSVFCCFVVVFFVVIFFRLSCEVVVVSLDCLLFVKFRGMF